MEYSYIINPLTNRKVSINSRKGQSILKAYLNQAQYAQAGGRRGRRGRGRKEHHSEPKVHQEETTFDEGYEPEQHSPEVAEARQKAREESWAWRSQHQKHESNEEFQDRIKGERDGAWERLKQPAEASSTKQGECRYNPVSKRCGRSSKHTLETDPETGITYCTESGGTKGHKYRACHHSDEWKSHLRGERSKSHTPVRVEKPEPEPELEEEVDYWSLGQDKPGEGWSERTGDDDDSEAWDEREWAKEIRDEPTTSDEDVSFSEEEDITESEIDRSQPHPIFGKVCQDKEKGVCQELHERGLCNWYEPKGKKPYCRSTGKFGALNPKSKSKSKK